MGLAFSAAPFVKLARSIREHRAGIDAALIHGLSNARVESINTKLRLGPGSRSGSAHPKHSSPSPCSISAACARRSPAAQPPETAHG